MHQLRRTTNVTSPSLARLRMDMPSRSTTWSPGLPKEETCVWRGEFLSAAIMDPTFVLVFFFPRFLGSHEHENARSLAWIREWKTRPKSSSIFAMCKSQKPFCRIPVVSPKWRAFVWHGFPPQNRLGFDCDGSSTLRLPLLRNMRSVWISQLQDRFIVEGVTNGVFAPPCFHRVCIGSTVKEMALNRGLLLFIPSHGICSPPDRSFADLIVRKEKRRFFS